MSSAFRKQLEDYISTINIRAGNVLDIGGSADPAMRRVNSCLSDSYVILDDSSEEGKHDKWTVPDIIHDLNLPINRSVDSGYQSKFDYVLCLEVFEYIWNPVQAIRNIIWFMASGGTLVISYPFVYPVHEPVEVDCLRYTPRGFELLLEKSGFQIEGHILRHGNSGLIDFYSADGMRMAKNQDHCAIGGMIKAKLSKLRNAR